MRIDGASLRKEDSVVWLAVHDGAGTHSTSLTEEGMIAISAWLVALMPKNTQRAVIETLQQKFGGGK